MILSRLRAVAASLLALPFMALQAQTGGLNAPQAVGVYFNGVFPISAPWEGTAWDTENAFPHLTFVDPLWLTEVPGTDQLLLVGKNGRIWRFTNHPATTQAQVVSVLDWSAETQTSEDQGFYRLVFHPQFGQAGSPNANYVFVCYSHKPPLAGADANNTYWRVSRFTWLPATGTIDPASEFVFINLYDDGRWHNGGAMYFDNDGFLNITNGDGGIPVGPPQSLVNTQRIDKGLFSGILRIDINNDPAKAHAIRRQPVDSASRPAGWPASSTQGYGIPNDNPWLDPAGSVLEEFGAIGLRSPHAAHYDAATGDVWIGDVGELTREELTRLPKGRNGQWGYREGTAAGRVSKPIQVLGIEQGPSYEYERTVGGCIIGGMRYRGGKWAHLLEGKVIFGDHLSGRIWSATIVAGVLTTVQGLVTNFPIGNKAGLGNFCTDSSGEIYLMTLAGTNAPGGTIRKLVRSGFPPEPPALLSQTGIFTDLQSLSTAPGVIPYDVASPLWSDGAEKRRWIILPNDGVHDTAAERIIFSEKGNWQFPAGTVFVKHFEIPVDERNPSLIKRLETRFLVCTNTGGKYGVTYRWNAEGTDAQLLKNGESVDFDTILQDGTSRPRRWDFPSRSDCLLCHTAVAGQALGVRTHQLNKNFHYPATGRTANQLATFNALGMFSSTLSAQDLKNYLQARPLEDTSAPLEHRVRSYLDSNCAHCHQPNGPVDSFDARLGTPLNLQGLIDGMIKGHFNMGPDGRYLKPGVPELSAIYVRAAVAGDGAAMPPLGKNLVHDVAVASLHDYVTALNPGEFQIALPSVSRPVRCEIAAPHGAYNGVFEVTVAFDMEVTDFSAADLIVDGGTVTGLRGKGYYYVATIRANSQEAVAVFIPPNAVNPNGAGSRPSNQVVVQAQDIIPPQAEFTNVPTIVTDAFQVRLAFSETVTGLTPNDFTITNGSLAAITLSGEAYVLTIVPTEAGMVGIELHDGAVMDLASNPMGGGISISVPHEPYVLIREAEDGLLSGGFTIEEDPTASGGAHIWIPKDSRGGVTAFDEGIKADYQFRLPRAGRYRVYGWMRSDEPSSLYSFYAGFNETVPPQGTLSQGPYIGIEPFKMGFYRDASGDSLGGPFGGPSFSAGNLTLQLYGKNEGCRLDKIELRPSRPFPVWSGPSVVSDGPFTVTLTFPEFVTGVAIRNLAITGGIVQSITGSSSGASYLVTILPQGPLVSLVLPAGVVSSVASSNDASDPFNVIVWSSFERWAFQHKVDVGGAARLADEDGDGLPKLIEFAFNLDPSKSDHKIMDSITSPAAGLPRLADSTAGNASLQFLRRKNVPGLTYVPQFGSTLGDFVPATGTEQVENIDADWERVTVQDTAAPAGAKTRFGRVKVIMTP